MKIKYLTKAERLPFSLSEELRGILVGLLLGDLYMQKRSKSTLNVRLMFLQGLLHKDYLVHLYELFKIYCSNTAKTTNNSPDKRTGVAYNSIYFYI
jgi:hypothetical protein